MGKKRRGGRNKDRKGKKGGGAGAYDSAEKGVRQSYEVIPKENAMFEKYYKMQKLVPEGEWDQFMASCRESLPAAFRVTGSRAEAKALLHIVETRLIKSVIEAGAGDEEQAKIKPFPLPWYPGRMAWQLNLSRKDIRKNEAYFKFHNFMISETDSGNISRQEAVSMIPPLCLNVLPHHKVLDMCASPGSKTAQIIEMLHAGDDSAIPEGYVVANDVDNKRCYMLVHQGKRLQSPGFVVTNQDAARFPDVFATGKDGQKEPLKFDRVLCDVPCSGDGTIRKNVDVWKKWSGSNSLYLNQVQSQILKRGMELLAVGGLLVYSTCSMNPMEDEAVIYRMLKEANGAVELLEIDMPNLKANRGVSSWLVCDRDINVYNNVEEVPERWKTTIRPNMFPPSEEEASSYHLDKCLRILPHQQNTGGFFIALLSKVKDLPWESSSVDTTAAGNDNGEAEDNGETKFNGSKAPPAKKPRRLQGYKEDPFIFMSEDHEIWPKIRDFYKLDDSLDSSNFLRRSEEGKIKNVYMTSKSVRDFVINNEKTVKIVNVGVKALARIDNKWSPCNFRLSQEGLPSIAKYVKARRVRITKEELIVLMERNEEDKAPLFQELSEVTRNELEKIERGSMVLVCEFPVDDNGPICSWELVGWRGAQSLRVYVQKNDRMHYLRLCGLDLSKYEINKFKDKEVKPETENAEGETGGESSNTAAVEEVSDVIDVSKNDDKMECQ